MSLLILLTLLSEKKTYGQSNSVTIKHSELGLLPIQINLTNNSPADLNHYIKSAKIYFHLNLLKVNEFYKFQNCNYQYSLQLNFNIANTAYASTLSLRPDQPEAMYIIDITEQQASNISFQLINSKTLSQNGCDITNDVKFEIRYEIEYGVDIRTNIGTLPQLYILPVEISGKRAKISWANNANVTFPNYQLQVLKLNNESANHLESPENIYTTIKETDWQKSFDIYTESSECFYELTLAEDNGFYVCRVRPIGNFYSGGVANHNNWSDDQWSYIDYSIHELDALNVSAPYFYYSTDPDELINWIYSRIFTEGKGHISEQITYATGLNQIKQIQKHLPSVNTNVVVQNIYDYSGRQAITTLGIPITGGITGYKTSFVQDENNELYNAKQFDLESNYLKPSKISQSNNFKYYSADNTLDNQIPSAEGYPYSRSIYTDDGTGRITEQSSPGYSHALHDDTGNDLNRRTVKTFYGKATEMELIRVFGEEAPAANTVSKTITIDQNNVVSISYFGIDGKLIATCLSNNNFPIQNEQLLGIDNTTNTPVSLQDVITQNIKSSDGFISSHKIFIDQSDAELKMQYIYNCNEIEYKCGNLELDCGIFLHLEVFKANEAKPIWEKHFTESALFCGQVIDFEPIKNLEIGEYVIVKTLTSNKELIKTDFTSTAENSINPIVNWIKQNIQGVYTESEQKAFYSKVVHFSETLNNCVIGNNIPTCNALINLGIGNELNLTTTHEMHLLRIINNEYHVVTQSTLNNITSFGDEILYIYLKSDCCDAFLIPCIFEAQYKCNNDNPPKFEQYLKDILGTDDIYQTYLPGYNSGEFDSMIKNMALIDKYDIFDGKGSQLQYDCDMLWNAWVSVTSAYGKFQTAGLNSTINISEKINPTEHDKQFDNKSNFKAKGGFFIRWLIKRKLSKLARERSASTDNPPSNNVNLVEDFFKLVGYKFTRPVITGTPAPPDYNNNLKYYVGPGTQKVHPYIKDRTKAYKYYEYVKGTKKACETLNCFEYKPITIPYCQDVPVCGTTSYNSWSNQNIMSFYTCINNLEDKAPELEKIPCDSINTFEIYRDLVELCNSNCDSNFIQYKSYIESVFIENCYEIDGCETNYNSISSKTIESLAKYSVQLCKRSYCDQLDEKDVQCIEFSCTDIYTGNAIRNFSKIILPNCEMISLQVSEWYLELGIKNLCSGVVQNSLCTDGDTKPTVERDCNNPNINLDDIKHTQLRSIIVKVSSSGVTIE